MVFSSVTFLFYFLPIFIFCYVLTPTVVGKNVVTHLFSLGVSPSSKWRIGTIFQ